MKKKVFSLEKFIKSTLSTAGNESILLVALSCEWPYKSQGKTEKEMMEMIIFTDDSWMVEVDE